MILASRGAGEDHGLCYGLAFVYSGSFQGEALKDQYDQTRLIMGLPGELWCYPLDVGENFIVPETVMSCSAAGLDN